MADALSSTRQILRTRMAEAQASAAQLRQQAQDLDAKAVAARREAGERQLDILQIRAALVSLDVEARLVLADDPKADAA